MKTSYAVTQNEAQSRFEVVIDGHTAVLEYQLEEGKIIFTHTGVPAALEGRGVGSALAKHALAFARAKNLNVLALCWFVEKYMQRHPNE
ncbi:MAG: GNAT family N-acetyltransferase [Anaerolineales bacterium]